MEEFLFVVARSSLLALEPREYRDILLLASEPRDVMAVTGECSAGKAYLDPRSWQLVQDHYRFVPAPAGFDGTMRTEVASKT